MLAGTAEVGSSERSTSRNATTAMDTYTMRLESANEKRRRQLAEDRLAQMEERLRLAESGTALLPKVLQEKSILEDTVSSLQRHVEQVEAENKKLRGVLHTADEAVADLDSGIKELSLERDRLHAETTRLTGIEAALRQEKESLVQQLHAKDVQCEEWKASLRESAEQMTSLRASLSDKEKEVMAALQLKDEAEKRIAEAEDNAKKQHERFATERRHLEEECDSLRKELFTQRETIHRQSLSNMESEKRCLIVWRELVLRGFVESIVPSLQGALEEVLDERDRAVYDREEQRRATVVEGEFRQALARRKLEARRDAVVNTVETCESIDQLHQQLVSLRLQHQASETVRSEQDVTVQVLTQRLSEQQTAFDRLKRSLDNHSEAIFRNSVAPPTPKGGPLLLQQTAALPSEGLVHSSFRTLRGQENPTDGGGPSSSSFANETALLYLQGELLTAKQQLDDMARRAHEAALAQEESVRQNAALMDEVRFLDRECEELRSRNKSEARSSSFVATAAARAAGSEELRQELERVKSENEHLRQEMQRQTSAARSALQKRSHELTEQHAEELEREVKTVQKLRKQLEQAHREAELHESQWSEDVTKLRAQVRRLEADLVAAVESSEMERRNAETTKFRALQQQQEALASDRQAWEAHMRQQMQQELELKLAAAVPNPSPATDAVSVVVDRERLIQPWKDKVAAVSARCAEKDELLQVAAQELRDAALELEQASRQNALLRRELTRLEDQLAVVHTLQSFS